MENNGKEAYIKILEDFIQKLRSDEVTDFEIESSNPPQMMFSHEHRDFIRVPSENHSIDIRYTLKKKEVKGLFKCPECKNNLDEQMFCVKCCSKWTKSEPYKENIEEAEIEWSDIDSITNLPPKTALDFINAAQLHMKDRASTYDNEEGERSMLATVKAFGEITGIDMTEEEGWLFMGVLKMVRSQQGDFKSDNYEDGTAYFALAGEAAAKNRK